MTQISTKINSEKKVALVYDRVNTSYGGAEKVLLALHDIFPQAPLFTSVYDKKQAKWADVFEVKTSFLQKIPKINNKHRALAPLMPLAFESLNLSSFDVIISVTSAEAKGILTKPNQVHICYLLTPQRYLYSHHQESLKSKSFFSKGWGKWTAYKFIKYLRWWDQVAIHRPDFLIPISQRIANRTKKYYSIEPEEIIYPPIDESSEIEASNFSGTEKFYLVVSRLVYYKRIDLAIKSCQKAKKKLIVVGHGPEFKQLKKLASKTPNLISFKKNVLPDKLNNLYKNCQALIMPGEEDFGIVALEVNAHGKPAIIYKKSGAAELIKNGVHGFHIENQSIVGIIEAIKKTEKTTFNSEILVKNSQKYNTNIFTEKFSQAVKKML